jgi:hypothetical protein
MNQMKKILYLDRAASLKNQLERGNAFSIEKDNEIIENNNTVPTTEVATQVDISEIEQRKQMKSDLLKILYIATLTANLKKLKDENNCLAYYIKTLSELEREKVHLIKVEKKDNEKKTPISKKIIKFFSFIKPKEILRRNEAIDKSIAEVKDKIAKYNKETKISIEITQEMSEFLKSLEN